MVLFINFAPKPSKEFTDAFLPPEERLNPEGEEQDDEDKLMKIDYANMTQLEIQTWEVHNLEVMIKWKQSKLTSATDSEPDAEPDSEMKDSELKEKEKDWKEKKDEEEVEKSIEDMTAQLWVLKGDLAEMRRLELENAKKRVDFLKENLAPEDWKKLKDFQKMADDPLWRKEASVMLWAICFMCIAWLM